MAEEERNRKAKEEFMTLLRDDLATLKSKQDSMNKLQFLKFLYETYPPKNPLHVLSEVSTHFICILLIS
jgi:hypothetical protein